jgi:hypothetical protein
MNWERAFVYTLLAAVAVVLLSGWVLERRPSPRMDIQWHQTCHYAMSPDTLEAIGRPAYPCDREYWDI